MRGEQRAAAVDLVQMFDVAQAIESPSKVAVPRPISSRMTRLRAARLVEDRRGLDHLDHEGRAAAREIVGGADAAEQAVDDADVAALAGTKLPICAMTAISAFWRRKVDLPAMLGPVSSQSAALAQDRNRSARRFRHRVAIAAYAAVSSP